MSQNRLFGTDGVRAPFGQYPLDKPTVCALGRALGEQLGAGSRVVLGGDTRDSSPTLARWLASGLAGQQVAAQSAGVLPTPGIAFLTRQTGATAGIALSASHNPYPDNGIKLIDGAGFKWSEEAERELEGRLANSSGELTPDSRLPPVSELERLDPSPYRASLLASLGNERPLAGLRLVLDTGHGAASELAGPLFVELGAKVEVIADQPDGQNINRGYGSTHPEALAARIRETGADLGFAFDGDADRAILVDDHGVVRDGDAILYLWARHLVQQQRLSGRAIVVTSMSNLGLERALRALDVTVLRCGVGDREVVATLRRNGLVLGGEQSGHIVHLDLATTGDGLLTALQTAALVRHAERPVSEQLAAFERYPQVLQNVTVAHKPDLGSLPTVAAAARAAEDQLGQDGRLVLRYSGTEPLARIMIEGPDQNTIEELAGNIAEAINGAIGAVRLETRP
ncbi:MAG: phosphoglucosamine mutase [Acidobacteriota bacterium]